VLALGIGGTIVGALVLLTEVTGASGTADPAPWILVIVAGSVSVGLSVRQQIRVDERGIRATYVRTARVAWPDVAGVTALQVARGPAQLLVLDRMCGGRVLGACRDVDLAAMEIERRRPLGGPDVHDARGAADAPAATDDARPGRILLVPAPWNFAFHATTMVLFAVLTIGMALSTAPVVGWSHRVFSAVMTLIAVVGVVVGYRRVRRALVADGEAITILRPGGDRRIPFASIDEVRLATTLSDQVVVVLLGAGGARGLDLPQVLKAERAADLVRRIEAQRAWAHAHPGAGPLPAQEQDTAFGSRLPAPWVRQFAPAALVLLAVAMAASGVVQWTAAGAAADEVEARSEAAGGTVTAVDTWAAERTALVSFPTGNGPVTVELPVDADEARGDRALALRYDPQHPEVVWRANGGPPLEGNHVLLVFVAVAPLALAVGLWLRWHPPGAPRTARGEPAAVYAAGP